MRRTPRLVLLFSLLAGVLLVTAVAPAPAARAVTTIVTTLFDENGTGAACSLREAIQAATTDMAFGGCPAGSGADLITVTGAGAGTITLTPAFGPLLVGMGGLTIQGPGAASLTISGGGAVRLLEVGPGAQLTLADLTLAQGHDATEGGAIRNDGTLTITNSTFSDNHTTGPLNLGGVIFNVGSLTITSSTFSDNHATGSFSEGGAILNAGSLTITSSTFSANTASAGGAISNDGSLTITASTFSDNTAGVGGAISNNSPVTTTISASTFSGNQASQGGAIYNNSSALTITNSTLTANTATGPGGGSAIFTTGSPSSVALTSSTIAAHVGSPVLAPSNGSVSLHNVVLANLPAASCDPGTITDLGGNLADDASCPVTTASSHTSTNPLLGPLANNSGPTQTMALLSGSPAIEAGVGCPPPATDQRGVTRPQGPACDSGAFEAEPLPPPPVVTVSLPPPDGSNGWHRTSPVLTPVTATTTAPSTIATLTCTAGALGPVSGLGTTTATAPLSVSAQGATTGACSATSLTSAPGSSASFTIRLDSLAPTLTAGLTTADGQPYTPGSQATQPVTVTFTCTDATSGVAGASPPVTLSSVGLDQTAMGTCTDQAGNSTTLSVSNIDIPKLGGGPAPSPTSTPGPAPSPKPGQPTPAPTATPPAPPAGTPKPGPATPAPTPTPPAATMSPKPGQT